MLPIYRIRNIFHYLHRFWGGLCLWNLVYAHTHTNTHRGTRVHLLILGLTHSLSHSLTYAFKHIHITSHSHTQKDTHTHTHTQTETHTYIYTHVCFFAPCDVRRMRRAPRVVVSGRRRVLQYSRPSPWLRFAALDNGSLSHFFQFVNLFFETDTSVRGIKSPTYQRSRRH